MKKEKTVNTFNEGLIMDLNPIATPNNVYCNALNATITTMNGNENVLQNDMGNGRVETAYLPEGYVPLGTAELGGIIYIVSYNPLKNKCQIGSFPSPERTITSSEIRNPIEVVSNEDFQSPAPTEVTEGTEKTPLDLPTITNTIKRLILLDTELSPGDQYVIYSDKVSSNASYLSDYRDNNSDYIIGNDPLNVTIHVVSIEENGKITYLDDSLKWYNNYYIKELTSGSVNIETDIDEYRSLVRTAYNTFTSKVPGKLALLFEVEVIDTFSVTWDANIIDIEESQPSETDKQANIDFYFNYTSRSPKINPSYVKMEEYLDGPNKNAKQISYYSFPDNLGERANDGTDTSIKVFAKALQYSSDEIANTTWNYTLTPAMKFGLMTWLHIDGRINLSELGSGKIELIEWRYYRQPDNIILNWGLEAYPEKNKTINGITFEFVPFDRIEEKNEGGYIFGENNVQLKIFDEPSYSGYFQRVIQLGNYEDISNVVLYKDYLYLVKITIDYTGNSKTHYRWIYTTDQWNNKYLDATCSDFKELTLDSVLAPQLTNSVVDNIEHTSLIPENIELSDSTEQMDFLKAQVNTVNYFNGEFSELNNLSGTLGVTYGDYSTLFQFIRQDRDNHEDTFSIDSISYEINANIPSNNVPAGFLDKISPDFSTQSMDGSIKESIEGILGTANSMDTLNPPTGKLKDQFTISILDNNENGEYQLSVQGVMFSRVLYIIQNTDVSVQSVLRPIILYESDLQKNNLQALKTNLEEQYYIKKEEGVVGEGNMQKDFKFPICFFAQSRNRGGDNIELVIKGPGGDEDSNYSTYGKGDNLQLSWEQLSAYTEFMLPRMQGAGGIFQVLRGDANDDQDVNWGISSITRQWITFVKTDKYNYFIPVYGFSEKDTSEGYIADQQELPGRVVRLLMSLYTVTTNDTGKTLVKPVANTSYCIPYYQEILNIKMQCTATVDNWNSSTNLFGKSGNKSLSDLYPIASYLSSNDLLNNVTVSDIKNKSISQTVPIQHTFNVNDYLNNRYFDELSNVQVKAAVVYSTENGIEIKELDTTPNSELVYFYQNNCVEDGKESKVLSTYTAYGSAFNYLYYECRIGRYGEYEQDGVLYIVPSDDTHTNINMSAPSFLFRCLKVIDGELCFDYSQILTQRQKLIFHDASNSDMTFTNCSNYPLISTKDETT